MRSTRHNARRTTRKFSCCRSPWAEIGFSRALIPNGTYNLIDKDGFHYAPFGGLKIIKTTDGNDPKGVLSVAKVKDLSPDVPAELAKSVTHIVGMGMTYDGNVVAAAGGAMFQLDRDLNLKGMLPFPASWWKTASVPTSGASTSSRPRGC